MHYGNAKYGYGINQVNDITRETIILQSFSGEGRSGRDKDSDWENLGVVSSALMKETRKIP